MHTKLQRPTAASIRSRALPLITGPVLLAFAAQANANELTFTDYATIESVDPIVTRERVNEPVQECVPLRAARPSSRSPYYRERVRPPHEVVRSVIGGLIGGAIGSRFGDGRGRKALTIAGAMGGAALAGRSSRRDHDDNYVYHRNSSGIAERCQQVMRVRDVEVISAYRVRYRYQGQSGTRVVREPPGEKLPVTVTLRPLAGLSRQP
ncbi:MAG: hypothetical protein AAGG11_21690 [Pseudomonadota bacterium]